MEIAVVGAGKMSALLGGYWARGGHNVIVGSRDRGRAAALATQIGGVTRSGSYAEAIASADVILLAVTPDVAVGIAHDNAAALVGKIVIDCNTRHYPGGKGDYPIPKPPSLAEAIAAAAPGARVVKAFASIGTGVLGYVLQQNRTVVDGKRTSIFYCASDPGASQCIRGLIDELHLDAIDCGDLRQAYYLETLGALTMWLADQRVGQHFAINLVRDRRDDASPLDRFM